MLKLRVVLNMSRPRLANHKIITKRVNKKYEKGHETIFGQPCADKDDCLKKERETLSKLTDEQDCV